MQHGTVAYIKRLLFKSCWFIHDPDKRINHLTSKLSWVLFRFVTMYTIYFCL